MSDELTTYQKWEDIPEGIATKTTLLRDFGLKLSDGQQPVARKVRYNRRGKHDGYYSLYAASDCVPKQPPTQAQLDALEKARYMGELLPVVCSKCGDTQYGKYDAIKVTRKQWIDEDYDNYVCWLCHSRQRATQWARDIICDDNYLILDTETTDLHGEIIEIAIINSKGEALLDERIKPLGKVSEGAQWVHGISLDMLAHEQSFAELYPRLKSVLDNQHVLIYNADFDIGRLNDDCKRHGLATIKFSHDCVMLEYARWYGAWSDYHDSFKWQPLEGGDHSALGDCIATHKRLWSMAHDWSLS